MNYTENTEGNIRANLTRDGNEYKLSSALRVGGTRKPRTRTVALSDCICYDAQGNVIKTIARNTRSKSTVAKSKRAATMKQAPRRTDISLMSTMGSIHEGDN